MTNGDLFIYTCPKCLEGGKIVILGKLNYEVTYTSTHTGSLEAFLTWDESNDVVCNGCNWNGKVGELKLKSRESINQKFIEG